jgi:hypothetical protein
MTVFGMMGRAARLLACLALVFTGATTLSACKKAAAPPEPTALSEPEDWPGFGRTGGEQHYSPLDQIEVDSVSKLSLAWHYDLRPENTLTGPVAAGGKLFITTGHSYIRAFEAATGKLLWEYDSKALATANDNALKSGATDNGTFAGNWDIVVDSPIGKQAGKGAFKVEGKKISGTQAGAQGSVDVQGVIDGSHATFTGKAYAPFPITLEFVVTLDGDTFSGTMKTGPFGTFRVSGKRL